MTDSLVKANALLGERILEHCPYIHASLFFLNIIRTVKVSLTAHVCLSHLRLKFSSLMDDLSTAMLEQQLIMVMTI